MYRRHRGQALLPHWIFSGQEIYVWHSSLCGSELARDSGGSACIDVGCTGLFAGKPAPTLDLQWARNLCLAQFPLWEQSLLAIAVGQLARMLDVPPPSRASLAPTLDLQWTRNLCSAQFPLWEQSLLAIAVGQLAWMLDVPASSRASLAPTLDLQWTRNLCSAQFPLWEQSLLAIAVGQLALMLDVPASSRASLAPTLDLQWARNLCSAQFPLWEQSLLAMAVGRLAWILDVPASSRASLAPTLDLQWTRNLCLAQFPLWEQSLLAIAVGQLALMLDVPASSRASPLPHWIFSGQEIYVWHSSLCGSELARDSGGSACPDVGCTAAIAGKPAPTLDLQWTRNLCLAQFPLWEQSLLAMAVGRLAWILDVPASSRASPLPHWIFSGQEIYVWHSSLCGSELARDSGGSACPDVGCTAAIAGKPCSHIGSWR